MALTLENFQKGFLIDETLMAGVTPDPENPDKFVAFVLNHASGEYEGYQPFDHLETALKAINAIQRAWVFEAAKNCGGCGEGKTCTLGECGTGSCHLTTPSV